MKTLKFFILLTLLFTTPSILAQKGHDHNKGHGHGKGHGKGPDKVVVVKKSHYRPSHVVVFHPHWRPSYEYHRRWVYFPQYNLYWDNWRNHYVYLDGNVWVSRPTAPSIIINVNLEKVSNRELEENYDDEDAVYIYNRKHKN